MLAWSLTGDRPLFPALLVIIKFSKKSKMNVMVSVNEKSTCCECEKITHLPGLLRESRYCGIISTRNNMYDTSFWTLNSLFLSPLFLQRTLEFHLALVTATFNIYTTIFTYL